MEKGSRDGLIRHVGCRIRSGQTKSARHGGDERAECPSILSILLANDLKNSQAWCVLTNGNSLGVDSTQVGILKE